MEHMAISRYQQIEITYNNLKKGEYRDGKTWQKGKKDTQGAGGIGNDQLDALSGHERTGIVT